MKTLAMLVALRHILGAVELIEDYSSLVDMRCRPFVHWMRMASA
jgi:hypothetical protein